MEQDNNVKNMEEKMDSYVDSILGTSNGMMKTAHPNTTMSDHSHKSYRSSFLTLSDMQIPDDYREIFRWCRYFFKFDSLVGAAVRAQSTFPITDWVLNDTKDSDDTDENEDAQDEEPSETYKFYKMILDDLDLYNHELEIGYDYFLYGNCVIFAEPGVKTIKRRNKETNEIYEKKEVVWKSIERLDVTRLRIDKDPETHEKLYYYDIPAEIKRVIKQKKPKEKYDKIPEVFKKAVDKKGLVKLKSKYIYHMQMPSESGDNGLWATPPVLHVMKLLLYSNVLRQAQEAIAYEHIVPKRIYYFQETKEFSPNMDFQQMADDFSFELKKQLDDPNYQIISPIPIQQIQHGGQGKALMLVPELEQLQETILAGMGVPREFVFGGVSYSGSTTSLRILENHFITYRTNLSNYINNFLIKRLAEIRGEWETIDDDDKLVTVSFSELKMQDDIQQKQLMINLNQQGKLPDEILYEKVLGLDAEKTVKQLQSERLRKLDEQSELQQEQVRHQQELSSSTQGQVESPQQFPEQPANGPTIPEPAENAYEGEGVEEQSEEQPTQNNGETQEGQGSPQQANQGEQRDGSQNRQALKIAQSLKHMSEGQLSRKISELPQDTAKRVMLYYNQLQSQEGADMRPMPENRPPRRQGGV